MIDLHLHTNMSDGTDTPLELLEKILAGNVAAFSVTDHDDLRANHMILDELKNRQESVKFITGVEISSVFDGKNLHLLCYDFDPDSSEMLKMVEDAANSRRTRVMAVFDHLKNTHGIIIPDKDKMEILRLSVPGNLYVANAAVKNGLTNLTRDKFFETCLDDMESRQYKTDAERLIKTVSAAGGYVSMAHPKECKKEYNLTDRELSDFVGKLMEAGLIAIEVFHSSHNEKEVTEYKGLAHKFDLKTTAGSDYHGTNKKAKIGQLNSFGYSPANTEITA